LEKANKYSKLFDEELDLNDMLHGTQKTVGFSKNGYKIKNKMFNIYDTGGQRMKK
jgi:hypothetical protein